MDSATAVKDVMRPRYPLYIFEERATTVEELMPIARNRIRKRYGYPGLYSSLVADKSVPKPRLLILTYPSQNPIVLEAIKRALIEAGAEEVDNVHLTDIGVDLNEYSAADGWREVTDRLKPMVEEGVAFCVEAERLRAFFEDEPSYNGYYAGEAAGPTHWQRVAGGNLQSTWLYATYEALIGRGNSYPDELWELLDQKVCETFGDAAAVHITDPQGTDISWDITEEQSRLWPKGANIAGHLLGSTIQAIRFGHDADFFLEQAKQTLHTYNGVICGTGNHTGYYPHMSLTIEGGMIKKVEGGGRYGELIREVIETYKDAEYPGFPHKGWAYFNDASIGTNPKSFRNSEGLWNYNDSHTNLAERLRAGVVHFGFGAEHWDEVFLAYARKHHYPTFHFPHVHNYFPTWSIKRRSDGQWINIIEDGYLTALNDPDVRRLASALGGPDLLTYDWVPYIPGINAPGDYMADYGRDPVAVIRREVTGEFERAAQAGAA